MFCCFCLLRAPIMIVTLLDTLMCGLSPVSHSLISWMSSPDIYANLFSGHNVISRPPRFDNILKGKSRSVKGQSLENHHTDDLFYVMTDLE